MGEKLATSKLEMVRSLLQRLLMVILSRGSKGSCCIVTNNVVSIGDIFFLAGVSE